MIRSPATLPPGPRTPTILQLVWWLLRLPPFLEACARRFGDVFTIRLPVFGTFLVYSAPDDLRAIFEAPSENFDDGGPYSFFARSFGPMSMLALTGNEHRRERGLLGPHFQGDRLRASGEVMRAAVRRSLETSQKGRPVPLRPLMETITFEVIAEVVLGLGPGSELTALLQALQSGRHPMIDAFARRFFSNPPAARGRRQADAWIDAQIAARRAAPRTGSRDDILAHLLRAERADGEPMSDASIRAEILLLLVSGHTTTAASLAWAFQLILRHPEVRARIETEIAATGADCTGGTGFAYLDATIKEALRLRPIVPLVFRRLAGPVAIRGRSIPAGVTLVPCIHLAHRRPEKYPDPDRFRPERFLGRPVDRYSWLPFGGGFRSCLGASFALLEMRVVIATTLATLRIELATPPSEDSAHQRGRFLRAPSDQLKVVLGKPDPLASVR